MMADFAHKLYHPSGDKFRAAPELLFLLAEELLAEIPAFFATDSRGACEPKSIMLAERGKLLVTDTYQNESLFSDLAEQN